MSEIAIEYIALDTLVPFARNSRTHTAEQVQQIAASIREFGWTNPVLIDEHNGIIAGHARVLAGKSLAIEKAPCIRLAHLSEAQRRAYVIADNKLALNSGWDDVLLKQELGELQAEGINLELLGFSLAEIAQPSAVSERPARAEPDAEKPHNTTGIIQYNIVFDSVEQQDLFYAMLRRLKRDYPELSTIGARLTRFIEETHAAL